MPYLTNEKLMLWNFEGRMFVAEGMGSFILPYPNLPEAEPLALTEWFSQASSPLYLDLRGCLPNLIFKGHLRSCSWLGHFINGTCKFSLTQASRVEFCLRWCKSPICKSYSLGKHSPGLAPVIRTQELYLCVPLGPCAFLSHRICHAIVPTGQWALWRQALISHWEPIISYNIWCPQVTWMLEMSG